MDEVNNSFTTESTNELVAPDAVQRIMLSDTCSASTATSTSKSFEFNDASYAVYSREIRDMWTEPDASNVLVRGKSYMDDQIKVPAGQSIGKLLHVDLLKFTTAEERHHLAMSEELRPNSVLSYCREKFPESYVFLVNIELPSAECMSLVVYWLLPILKNSNEDETAFLRLLNRFCNEEDDDFRNNRFKLIPNLVEGPWLLQTLVPYRPALTGNKLTQRYFRGSNYFELDLDVSSSTAAQYIGSMCQSWASYLQMDLYLTIQGENEDELPERILGGVSFLYLDLELAQDFKAQCK